MSDIKLEVGGMTCMGCVKNVTNALKELDGVSNIDVSLQDNEAKLTIDESKIDVQTVVDKLEDIGFDAAKKD